MGNRKNRKGSWINAVIVSHEFTDHMHQETLLQISRTVPVFATEKAATAIRSRDHFDFVGEIARFGGDWRQYSGGRGVLPD